MMLWHQQLLQRLNYGQVGSPCSRRPPLVGWRCRFCGRSRRFRRGRWSHVAESRGRPSLYLPRFPPAPIPPSPSALSPCLPSPCATRSRSSLLTLLRFPSGVPPSSFALSLLRRSSLWFSSPISPVLSPVLGGSCSPAPLHPLSLFLPSRVPLSLPWPPVSLSLRFSHDAPLSSLAPSTPPPPPPSPLGGTWGRRTA